MVISFWKFKVQYIISPFDYGVGHIALLDASVRRNGMMFFVGGNGGLFLLFLSPSPFTPANRNVLAMFIKWMGF